MPLMRALPIAHRILTEEGIRDRLKILASGKLINAGRQLQAISLGADAVAASAARGSASTAAAQAAAAAQQQEEVELQAALAASLPTQ